MSAADLTMTHLLAIAQHTAVLGEPSCEVQLECGLKLTVHALPALPAQPKPMNPLPYLGAANHPARPDLYGRHPHDTARPRPTRLVPLGLARCKPEPAGE